MHFISLRGLPKIANFDSPSVPIVKVVILTIRRYILTGDKLLIRKCTIMFYVIHEEFQKCYKTGKFDEIILKH